MLTAEIYRQQAEAARRAAYKARSPSQYLMRLAESYDAQAAALEASYSGDRPTIATSGPTATPAATKVSARTEPAAD